MKYEKSCGAFVFGIHNTEDEILIIRQVQGHWCFPKGHMKKDETEIQTARREIREETGLKVKIVKGFRDMLSYSPKEGVMKDVVYFAAKIKEGDAEMQPKEVSEIRFVSLDEARRMITYANDADMFEKACAFFFENREEWL